MKIVSFTMVNNESEIIESFIRYNYNFVDEMVVIDNGCTDNTVEILHNLIHEGYKITIFDESLAAYDQFRLDNKYLNRIIDTLKPDFIIPLDADEFLTGDSNPREIIESLDLEHIYYVHWQWYVMTENDNASESFIPKRMQYCLKEVAKNYSDGSAVTKAIIPAGYFRKKKLTLSMGHHTVFGNDSVEIKELDNLRLAHFRAISELQLISKTCCYTMRDIATMSNNVETAQRTNQMALIESGLDTRAAAIESSFGGYKHDIAYRPLDLDYCKQDLTIRYARLANESLTDRVLKTGREMAIRAYNSERSKKEKHFLKPIVVWLDGIKGDECIFPDPSNEITIMAQKYNIRGYLTTTPEIRYLKVNYRLIVTPDVLKFLPHQYVVIPTTVDYDDIKKKLVALGVESDQIISLSEYKKHLGILGNIYSWIGFVPSAFNRVMAYVKRNGIKHALSKIQQRLSKD